MIIVPDTVEFVRKDGRAYNELRPVKIKAGVLKRADGSSYIELGSNKILAAVYGPRDPQITKIKRPDRAIIRCRYNMAPFSVEERKRPGPDRRSIEISKITAEALAPSIILEKFPRSSIDIFIEVLEADGGTRCAGITAASVALADAGIPLRDLVVACSAGKVNGHVVLDLTEEEDKEGEADVPVAIMPRTKEITLLQVDGELTPEELEKAIDLAIEGCMSINKLQKKSIERKIWVY
ncbi:ribosomal RNA-processing protein RRP41/SKI6 [Methanothermus fervidus DSM 2088]|uniref:Exosome complex component Rrp41 n=1 Tax=Methanothermus fervidus (strain ATCC 43054 / DSM 2088 / JCM 10308 / V24 S) TaxID=523846 RepID=E3GZ91_METFV|nr:exosome complex exonuclease Rrp41 [Methanothermus fervidus]ADP77623.1 ribosomal RNA-processing protein RRP41/SKI6 [Methanothermus fervidus DSM 2088]